MLSDFVVTLKNFVIHTYDTRCCQIVFLIWVDTKNHLIINRRKYKKFTRVSFVTTFFIIFSLTPPM